MSEKIPRKVVVVDILGQKKTKRFVKLASNEHAKRKPSSSRIPHLKKTP